MPRVPFVVNTFGADMGPVIVVGGRRIVIHPHVGGYYRPVAVVDDGFLIIAENPHTQRWDRLVHVSETGFARTVVHARNLGVPVGVHGNEVAYVDFPRSWSNGTAAMVERRRWTDGRLMGRHLLTEAAGDAEQEGTPYVSIMGFDADGVYLMSPHHSLLWTGHGDNVERTGQYRLVEGPKGKVRVSLGGCTSLRDAQPGLPFNQLCRLGFATASPNWRTIVFYEKGTPVALDLRTHRRVTLNAARGDDLHEWEDNRHLLTAQYRHHRYTLRRCDVLLDECAELAGPFDDIDFFDTAV